MLRLLKNQLVATIAYCSFLEVVHECAIVASRELLSHVTEVSLAWKPQSSHFSSNFERFVARALFAVILEAV